MDFEKTAPFELGPEDGERRCLLVHGFTGSPWDMRPLGEALAAAGHRVRGVRLPGHGRTSAAMEPVTFRDWEQSVEEAFLAFARDGGAFLAGLSMGALLSVLVAAKHPEAVRGLVLIAPAMHFKGRMLRLLSAFEALPFLPLVRPLVKKVSTDIEDPVARAEAPMLPSFPSARLHDLWTVQARAREALERVRAPTLVVAAKHDHVVSMRGARELARGLTSARTVKLVELERGFHIVPRDRDAARLFEEARGFLSRW